MKYILKSEKAGKILAVDVRPSSLRFSEQSNDDVLYWIFLNILIINTKLIAAGLDKVN